MRNALSVSVVALFLSACGGSSPFAPAPGLINSSVRPLLKSRTFQYTGHRQLFLVPRGVKSITIVARGAQGGGKKGGRGGRVYALIPVFSHEKLYVFVGGRGIGYHGGFNGGGSGGQYGGFPAYGGGGASDIRGPRHDHLSDRIIVAGGGGGGGQYDNAYSYTPARGGQGGGSTGGAGQDGCCGSGDGGGGGAGGSQAEGGAGGYGGGFGVGEGNPGSDGSYGKGGGGGAGLYYCTANGNDGGGGGGGYYGGGGGGAACYYGGGGGGGGSSYIESKATKFQSWQGWKNAIGDGLVVISWQ